MQEKNWVVRWGTFLCGLIFVWFLVQVAAPYGNSHLPGIERIIHVTQAKDINPGDFWYTDVEVSGEAIVYTTSSTAPALWGNPTEGHSLAPE
jgi:hypothetical protein